MTLSPRRFGLSRPGASIVALVLAGVASQTGSASAQENSMKEARLGTHELRVIETESFDQSLSIDGTEVLTDGLVLLDGQVEVAGQSVVTGIAGSGGNACNGTPFIVSLKDGAPQIDGPIESCSWFEMTVQPDALVFHTEAFAGQPAEIWTWTPVSGLIEAKEEAFTPDTTQSWEDFSWLSGRHPIDALGFAPVYAQLTAGMSAAAWQDYTTILGQLGSGGLDEKGYAGNACIKTDCDQEWAWLWIDQDRKQAVAFWKGPDDEEPQSWPADRSTWPDWIAGAAAEAAGSGG